MRHPALLLCLFVLTTACGFRPAYAPSSLENAGKITVAEIPTRAGYELRQALQDRLRVGLPGVEDGMLLVDLDTAISRLAVEPDGAASRSDARARASYTFTFGEQEITGRVSRDIAFNVGDSPYADISAQIYANARVAEVLADEILTDLRLKLANQDEG